MVGFSQRGTFFFLLNYLISSIDEITNIDPQLVAEKLEKSPDTLFSGQKKKFSRSTTRGNIYLFKLQIFGDISLALCHQQPAI